MFFNTTRLKTVLILLILLNSIFSFSGDNNNYKAVVENITNENTNNPKIIINNKPSDLNTGDIVNSNSMILTTDNQSVELEVLKNDIPIGSILILENTNLKIQENNEILELEALFGGIRCALNENQNVKIISSTVKAESSGADFYFLSKTKDYSIRAGYTAVFRGEVYMTSLNNENNRQVVNDFKICDFVEYEVKTPRYFSRLDMSEWYSRILFDSKNIRDNIDLFLENYTFESFNIEDSREITTENQEDLTDDNITEEKNIDETTDIVQDTEKTEEEKTKEINKYKILQSFLSFKGGIISYDKVIGISLVYEPGTILLNDKLEFGFYFPFDIVPAYVFTNQMFLSVNENNNEWSFGSDKYGNAGAVVFDFFDDFLLKHRIIRYNHPDDTIYVKFGNNFNVNDFLQYSMVNFNSPIFFPKYRKSSLYSTFKLSWFEALVYAEDILPKGIYSTDLQFMTPAKSFRFKFRMSAYLDCYDLINFENEESYFPGQFNGTLNFDSFNVPSFNFSIYAGAGIFIPFSRNFYDNTSKFLTLIENNPSAVASGISSTAGFSMRLKDLRFGMEFIVDSGLNKIGLFDNSYLAKRPNHKDTIKDYLDIYADRTGQSIFITDYNFGTRIKIGYNFNDFFKLDFSYQITFPVYYDKINFQIAFDSGERFKVNFEIFLQWQAETLINSFLTLKNFQQNHIIYLGSIIKPFSGIDIKIAGGLFPDFIYFSDPWYSQFVVEISMSIKPLQMYSRKPKGM